MFPTESSPLPALYGSWLASVLDSRAVPQESKATCGSCAMCPQEGQPPAAAYPFRPDVKCCVYMPEFPNFLAGLILADPDPELAAGQRSLRERLDARISVTPLGIGRPPAYAVHFDHTVNSLGRSTLLRCPHFRVDTQDCGVWKYRDHICSTYFCKHDRGRLGHSFWNAVRAWLQAIERSLARWCLTQLELPLSALDKLLAPLPDAMGKLDSDQTEGIVSESSRRQLWGDWTDREEAFYLACAELVRDLDWEGVKRVCGPEVIGLATLVRGMREGLDAPLPERLRTGSYQLLGVNAEGITAVTYSSTDPVAIPQAVLTVLHYFDGRPLDEISQALEHDRGLKIHDDLLRQLVDYGLFKEA